MVMIKALVSWDVCFDLHSTTTFALTETNDRRTFLSLHWCYDTLSIGVASAWQVAR